MRRYIFLVSAIALFAIGCNSESNILEPENQNFNEPNWISLPIPDGLSVNATYSTMKEIEGSEGGYLHITTGYRSHHRRYYGSGSYDNNVTIDAKAYFPEDSFSGEKNITMILDDKTCTATFWPHMQFRKDVIYSATFTGVDLSEVDPARVNFAYLAENGSVEYAKHDGIIVDKDQGRLVIINARIPHFSRYGFVN